jgi:hypothetical protein
MPVSLIMMQAEKFACEVELLDVLLDAELLAELLPLVAGLLLLAELPQAATARLAPSARPATARWRPGRRRAGKNAELWGITGDSLP